LAICRLKSGVPECPAALGRRAQAVDEALVERGVKERAACLLPFGRAPAKPVIELVAGHEAVIGTLKINSECAGRPARNSGCKSRAVKE
jgi:hypothetical protein